ncbi:MAG: metallophosphoesterase [Propionibacteriaceae bacterium]|nr:metallophosphoesterase [Propionibacteriaceae bacterium]
MTADHPAARPHRPIICPDRTRLGRVLVALVVFATMLLAPALPARANTGGTLTLESARVDAGQDVRVSYTADNPMPLNWVGIYRSNDVPGVQTSSYWQYAPAAAGTVTFTGVGEGDYVVYLLENDGYRSLAGPLPLTVGNPAPPPAPAAPHTPAPIDTTGTDGVLFREGFDALAADFQPRADDPGIAPGTIGFTHQTPAGWSSGFDASMEGVGVTEWRGWSFTTREFWTDAEDQMRFRFGRAQDVIAVVDSDEFADANNAPHRYGATLTSAPVPVFKHKAVELSFDSHYRGWAGQSAVVTVSFDGGPEREVVRFDSTTVTDNYDGSKINSNETHRIEVPNGKKTATFRWKFEAEANSWYWAIDSVTVSAALPAPPAGRTSAWVVSDIQGHPQDLSHGLLDLQAVRPDAAGLLMVGDIVDTGAQWQWDEIYGVLAERAEILPDTLAAAIGNHESYAAGGWPVLRDRFLQFAERDQVYGEYVLSGAGGELPVLVIGQEYARQPEVPMSAEQVAWLDQRLDHWSAQQKQVLVISHFPLGDTHSASWIPWYHNAYQYNDLLTEMLADHPNAVMLNGHTHYPAELGDWAVQRRTAEGHPDGNWAINTLAMHVEWDARGENTSGISEIVTRDINRGLTVDLYSDRMVVTARDFGPVATTGFDNTINAELRSVTIPNPFVQPVVKAPTPGRGVGRPAHSHTTGRPPHAGSTGVPGHAQGAGRPEQPKPLPTPAGASQR